MSKLVKDFGDYQFTYYWIDDSNQQISPNLPTLSHAHEWLVTYHHDQHEGTERRKTRYDRRHPNGPMRDSISSKRNPVSSGRRSTDRPVAVDLDLSVGKVAKLTGVI
ncbi:hypothetical protein [Neptuniibacter halophilus]|uniref:hypothetical protein n=1 Tax=Neptuniibacter halophilus TaxID=651666 RepID=UPI0025744FA8|nr:hypothetical protein [Neptuniibacter halophilus]